MIFGVSSENDDDGLDFLDFNGSSKTMADAEILPASEEGPNLWSTSPVKQVAPTCTEQGPHGNLGHQWKAEKTGDQTWLCLIPGGIPWCICHALLIGYLMITIG